MKKMTFLFLMMLICCVSLGASAEQSAPAQGGRTLVVYYSATGNTKEVGDTIAQALSADVLELVPERPYSRDDLNWRDDNSRVMHEYENPEARAISLVQDTVENWDAYDVVYIGYPIWWRIAAWPVNTFVSANDFSGKTVIPFCTSSSADLGESAALLFELTGTGTWLEGVRFSSGDDADDVREWVEGFDLATATRLDAAVPTQAD